GVLPIVCTAHQSYLARRDAPRTMEDLLDHDLIGFDRSDLLIRGARAVGAELTRDDFTLRSDSQTLLWELARAGLGVCFAQQSMVDATPGMVLLLPGLGIPPLEVWLATHRELF